MREATLGRGIAALGLKLDQGQRKTLLAYLQLLEKWNQHYNLTAIRDPRAMIVKHILDSLSICSYLQGLRVLHRIQDYRPASLFDTVVTRAFAKLADFVVLAGPLCQPGGCLLAMKGGFPEEELRALPAAFKVIDVSALSVPEIAAQRHLVRLRPKRAGED